MGAMNKKIVFMTVGLALMKPIMACRKCDEEAQEDAEAWMDYDYDNMDRHGHTGSRRRDLQAEIKKLQNEAQARKDARKALTPDFWEIHRISGDDDKYRVLEQSHTLRHGSVQLSSSPKYETVFPSKDEWSVMFDDVRNIGHKRARRLSKKPSWAKGEL